MSTYKITERTETAIDTSPDWAIEHETDAEGTMYRGEKRSSGNTTIHLERLDTKGQRGETEVVIRTCGSEGQPEEAYVTLVSAVELWELLKKLLADMPASEVMHDWPRARSSKVDNGEVTR